MKLLTRTGYLIKEEGMTYIADTDASDHAMSPLQSAACTYRIALGPQGKRMKSADETMSYVIVTLDQISHFIYFTNK